MSGQFQYQPGPARGVEITKEGERWTLVIVREVRHAPEKVWRAITQPEHLHEWAPFDADSSLGVVGATVKLSTVGSENPYVSETLVTRADEPHILEYKWGENETRWELEAIESGTRLTLWTKIDRRFISMGAAGWHICIDIMELRLGGTEVERIVGPSAMKFEGWQRLNAEYAQQFGIEPPKW